MKTQVSVKDLPNGSVPYNNIADANTRNVIMILNENIVSLGKRCKTLEKAVSELQSRLVDQNI